MWRGVPRVWPAAIAALLIVAVALAIVIGRRLTTPNRPATTVANLATTPSPSSPLASPTVSPPDSPTPSPAAPPSPAAAPAAASGPGHFTTLAPGSALPSSAQCASWVRATSKPENKRVNASYNRATGEALAAGFFPTSDDPRANTQLGVRVDGAFTGTTHQVLRWAACKWGIDEDIVYAQAAKESWWRQSTLGDYGTDPTRCPAGHGLGVDGQAGKCPESWGILQNRYPYEQGAWPGAATSTAMNADTAYAIWRVCFEGYERWLNDVTHVGTYGAGDAWGCVGRWFAGRWHTSDAEGYIASVQGYQSQRIWEQSNFQEA